MANIPLEISLDDSDAHNVDDAVQSYLRDILQDDPEKYRIIIERKKRTIFNDSVFRSHFVLAFMGGVFDIIALVSLLISLVTGRPLSASRLTQCCGAQGS